MKKFFLATALLTITLAPAQTPAPTPAELLQKGIYAQETSGDLDAAIKTYRQIVDSHPQQRDLGAQAQYRLAMTLLAKGDTISAAQEIQRLGWDYPDFKDLIAAAGKPGLFIGQNKLFFLRTSDSQQGAVQVPITVRFNTTPAQHETMFNFTKSDTITGTVVQLTWSNPYTLLTIASGTADPPMRVFVASAKTLERAGWTSNTLGKPGDQVTVTGAPALDGSSTLQATSVSLNGQVIFSRPNGPLPQAAMGAYEK